MASIFLSNDKQAVLMVRRLLAIKSYCGIIQEGYRMPLVSKEEHRSAEILEMYCERNIKEALKGCKVYANISIEEDEEELDAHKNSPILKTTTGTGCVLAGNEAELTLQELKSLNKCATIRKALETGMSIIIK